METCTDNQQVICNGQFKALHVVLDRVDAAIRGNGKPGIMTRLDRLEQAKALRSKILWFVLGIAGTGTIAILVRVISLCLSHFKLQMP